MANIKYFTREGEFEISARYTVPFSNLHRVDGPAIIFSNGDKEWWIDGRMHREDGPALETIDGRVGWRLNSYQMTLTEYINQNPRLKTDAERLMFYLRWK